ncbi:MAG: HIT domain-containing protein [Deltaproteobacteria bacterium]|nr:HIT domain-containing protein [Deltaproteobacteria bacterium]MBW2016811.1 HIT domain-containing protein [Deltaproteobacteria bacterium]
MKVLWAPWRMKYILSEEKDEGCIFCPGPERSEDSDRLFLHVGTLSLVMMNRFPYNNGHLLVAPVRHVPGLEHLSDEELLDLMHLVRRSVEILKKVMNPEGFNVGLNLGRVAGAGVEEHMHFHIVPRWNGDTNFMTVLGEVRVIPEHIRETYEKLVPHFKSSNNLPGGIQ